MSRRARKPASAPAASATRTLSSGSAPAVWWRASVIALAGVLAYSNALTGPFIFDDPASITENLQIRQWWRLGTVLFPERELPTAGRPLVNLSFAINYALGELNVVGYHVLNIALHILCAWLVFGIVRRTFDLIERPGEGGPTREPISSPRSANLACAVALIWVLHPLNTEAVNYLTQRTEIMMALFYLLTLYASIRAAQSPRALAWSAAAVVSCAAGMASKESMVTAPLMVVLFDRTFVFDSLKQALTRRWRLYAGLATTWLLLGVLLWSGPRIHSAGFSSGVSPWTYLLNQTGMIVRYLRLAVWPNPLVLNYGWPAPLTIRDVLPSLMAVVALGLITVFALAWKPRLGFLGAWLFVTLAPTSSIVPIATEVGAERRMYLPLVALIVLGVVLVDRALRLSTHTPASAATAALAIVSTALAITTFQRNREYASSLVLAQTIVERYPTSLGHEVLGEVLILNGRHDEAIPHLRQALPAAPRAHYSLGFELLNQGKLDEALAEFQTFVRERPLLLEAVNARQAIGTIFGRQQRWPEAIEQFRLVLTMNPTPAERAAAEGALGESFSAQQHYADAIEHYRAYLRLRPDDAATLNRLGIALVATGQLDDALPVFRRATDLSPQNVDLQRNLANALFEHHDVDDAAVYARRAIALRPDDSSAHELLGRALALQGKFSDARTEFERALQSNPGNADAREYLKRLNGLVAK